MCSPKTIPITHEHLFLIFFLNCWALIIKSRNYKCNILYVSLCFLFLNCPTTWLYLNVNNHYKKHPPLVLTLVVESPRYLIINQNIKEMKLLARCSSRWKVRGSPRLLQVILRGTWISEAYFIPIHPILVEIVHLYSNTNVNMLTMAITHEQLWLKYAI